jgi:hypothetical protein
VVADARHHFLKEIEHGEPRKLGSFWKAHLVGRMRRVGIDTEPHGETIETKDRPAA